jgi:hypothetical protein
MVQQREFNCSSEMAEEDLKRLREEKEGDVERLCSLRFVGVSLLIRLLALTCYLNASFPSGTDRFQHQGKSHRHDKFLAHHCSRN